MTNQNAQTPEDHSDPNIEIPGLDKTKTCICGAIALDGHILCRKCHARERWERRQAKRRKTNKRRGETRRPPNRPRTASFGTVTL